MNGSYNCFAKALADAIADAATRRESSNPSATTNCRNALMSSRSQAKGDLARFTLERAFGRCRNVPASAEIARKFLQPGLRPRVPQKLPTESLTVATPVYMATPCGSE
jgi:hypothetical protein